jgi:poly-gamma-glutamate synthesis protein (capsule biosynthesis protein)
MFFRPYLAWIPPLLLVFVCGTFFLHTFFSFPVSQESDTPSVVATSTAVARFDATLSTHRAMPQTKAFFDRAYDVAESLPAFSALPRGIILPHHLVAAREIAGVMKALEAHPPKRIVMIGPDHLLRAHHHAILSEAVWHTAYGDVRPDTPTIAALKEKGVAVVEEPVFGIEHSLAALLPFVKRSLPETTIVPILVRNGLTPHEQQRLAAALPDDGDTLIIASVDFSHYQPSRVAAFHDLHSRAVLATGAVDGLAALEADSPETLSVLVVAMAARGAQRFELLRNTNSAEMLGDRSLRETTSYIIGAFVSGPPVADPIVTVLATGDLMFDRAVRGYTAQHGVDYPFALLRGAEDRFFRGVDIITGNLEGAIAPRRAPEKENDFAFDVSVADLLRRMRFSVVSLANNHAFDQGRLGAAETQRALSAAGIASVGDQLSDDVPPWTTTIRGRKVAMLGFNMTDRPVHETEVEAAVRGAAKANDILLVQVHWGAEYHPNPTDAQRAFGRQLVEWGATAVIGTHPHVIEGMEVWKGRPIFWSLGNTIFDQDWSEETQQGMLLGLAIGERGITTYLLPIRVEKGQPRLVVGKEDERMLGVFADRSDVSDALRAETRTGIVQTIFE